MKRASTLSPSIHSCFNALVLAVMATLAFPAAAADIEKGRQKADQICATCHGKDGNTPVDPSYPRLAGQHRDYLVQALKSYREPEKTQAVARRNGVMQGQAKLLTPADIENVAAYYASLPGTLSHHRQASAAVAAK